MTKCPRCQRLSRARAVVCQWCGAPLGPRSLPGWADDWVEITGPCDSARVLHNMQTGQVVTMSRARYGLK